MENDSHEINYYKEKIKELEERVDFYKLMIDNTLEWEIFRNQKGEIAYINEAFEKLTGFSCNDLLNKVITEKDIVHPEDWAFVAQNLKQSNLQIPVTDLEFRIITAQKQIRYINLNAIPVFKNNQFVGTRTSARDITDQKDFIELQKTNMELKKKDETFKTYIQSSPLAIFLANENGKYSFVNPQACKLLNYTENELLQLSIADILPIEFKEVGYNSFLELKEFGISKDVETKLLKKDGSTVEVLLDGKKLSENEYIAFVKDITERKQTEKIIKEQNEEYATLNEEYKTIIEELQKAKENIEKSEIQIRKLFENMEQGFALHKMIYDENNKPIDYQFILINRAFEKLTGFKAADLVGTTVKTAMPNTENIWIENYGKVATTGVSIRFESFSQELQKYYDAVAYCPQKDYFAVIFNDITENILYEHELLKAKEQADENDEKHRFLFENMKQGVIYHEADGQIAFANKAASEILGLTLEQLQGKTSFDPNWKSIREDGSEYPGEEHPAIITIKTGKPVNNQIMGIYNPKKDAYNWININSIPRFKKNSNTIYQIIVTFEDITDIRNAKIQTEESQQRFKALHNASFGGITIHDKGYILDCNQGLSEISGYSFDELIGMNGLLLITEKTRDFVLQNIINGYEKPYEAIGLKKNGQEYPLRLEARNIPYKGKMVRVVEFRDITEQKNAEAEILKAKEKAEESDRLKTAFLQNMSHEIRTPMNAIIGFSEFLNDPDLLPEKRKSFISIVQNSTYQLLAIVTDILTISSLETKQEKISIEKVSINNIIIDLLATFKPQAQKQNIQLYSKQTLNDQQSEIYTDNTKLIQILTNLLTNALKFTHEGFIEFGYNLKNKSLQFYVKDTGIGIKPELQEIIFERFRQADLSITKKYGGTGLGLSISKGFVELMGGKIWVVSEPNKGATFFVEIPYNPVKEIPNHVALEHLNHKNEFILVVEDEQYNFLYIEEILINLNLKHLHAKNGLEAVEICKKNKNISLVLMDIKMPIMDGHTATLLIKEFLPDLPIVAQSAYALEQEIEEYSGIFDDYLPKPIKKETLTKTISKYINQ